MSSNSREAQRRYTKRFEERHPERIKFHSHKMRARRRGIPFLLTFEEWWSIWQQSGHWHERGCKRGQYVMARPGDSGPYAVDNVKIVPMEINQRDKGGTFAGHRHSIETIEKVRIAALKQARDIHGRYIGGQIV